MPVAKGRLPCYLKLLRPSVLTFNTLLYKKVFLPSTETYKNFSRFKYQNFLITFLAKIFEFIFLARAHQQKVKSSTYT